MKRFATAFFFFLICTIYICQTLLSQINCRWKTNKKKHATSKAPWARLFYFKIQGIQPESFKAPLSAVYSSVSTSWKTQEDRLISPLLVQESQSIRSPKLLEVWCLTVMDYLNADPAGWHLHTKCTIKIVIDVSVHTGISANCIRKVRLNSPL